MLFLCSKYCVGSQEAGDEAQALNVIERHRTTTTTTTTMATMFEQHSQLRGAAYFSASSSSSSSGRNYEMIELKTRSICRRSLVLAQIHERDQLSREEASSRDTWRRQQRRRLVPPQVLHEVGQARTDACRRACWLASRRQQRASSTGSESSAQDDENDDGDDDGDSKLLLRVRAAGQASRRRRHELPGLLALPAVGGDQDERDEREDQKEKQLIQQERERDGQSSLESNEALPIESGQQQQQMAANSKRLSLRSCSSYVMVEQICVQETYAGKEAAPASRRLAADAKLAADETHLASAGACECRQAATATEAAAAAAAAAIATRTGQSADYGTMAMGAPAERETHKQGFARTKTKLRRIAWPIVSLVARHRKAAAAESAPAGRVARVGRVGQLGQREQAEQGEQGAARLLGDYFSCNESRAIDCRSAAACSRTTLTATATTTRETRQTTTIAATCLLKAASLQLAASAASACPCRRRQLQAGGPFMAMISYVQAEARDYALLLKGALERVGVSVYLDLHEIGLGADWQDSLNEGVLGCPVLVPLVTPSYGQTLWTGRELKLADVAGKLIVPVNFGQSWPPPALAIQFATKQYVCWLAPDAADPNARPLMRPFKVNRDRRGRDRWPRWPPSCAANVAKQIKRTIERHLNELAYSSSLGSCGSGSLGASCSSCSTCGCWCQCRPQVAALQPASPAAPESGYDSSPPVGAGAPLGWPASEGRDGSDLGANEDDADDEGAAEDEIDWPPPPPSERVGGSNFLSLSPPPPPPPPLEGQQKLGESGEPGEQVERVEGEHTWRCVVKEEEEEEEPIGPVLAETPAPKTSGAKKKRSLGSRVARVVGKVRARFVSRTSSSANSTQAALYRAL